MRSITRWRRSRSAVVLAALSTTACVNLPYIEPTRQAPVLESSKGSLEDAIGYADRSYDAYEAKVVEEWQRQQGLSTFLIGAGALAVGAGLAHAHRDVFLVLGLGSATAYQLGNWNHNPGRVGIYLDGMKALVCAKAAVQPLRLSDQARERIRSAQRRLATANTTAANAMALAGPARINPGSTEAAQALQAELQGLTIDLEEAWRQHSRGASMDQRIDGAGAMLQQKVDQIRTSIDTALHETQADPVTLRAAIQGLSAYALQFNTDAQGGALAIAQGLAGQGTRPAGLGTRESQKPSDAAGPSRDAEASIGRALGAVSGARIELKGATAELRGTIDRQFEGIGDSLNGCGVDTSKLTTSFALEESAVQLKAGQVRTMVILVKGGTRPLSMPPPEIVAPGLNVSLSPEGGSVIIAADTKTEEGSYRYKVRDAAGQTASIVVTVTAATTTAPAVDDAAIGPASLCDKLGSLSLAKVCFLQRQLQVTVDGTARAQTCDAFRKHVAQRASTTAGGFEIIAQRAGLEAASPDEDYLAKLGSQDLANCSKARASNAGSVRPATTRTAEAATAGDSADAPLSQEQIAAMARALGQPKATSLQSLREALADNQRVNNCPNTNGLFTPAEVKRLYSGSFKCR